MLTAHGPLLNFRRELAELSGVAKLNSWDVVVVRHNESIFTSLLLQMVKSFSFPAECNLHLDEVRCLGGKDSPDASDFAFLPFRAPPQEMDSGWIFRA